MLHIIETRQDLDLIPGEAPFRLAICPDLTQGSKLDAGAGRLWTVERTVAYRHESINCGIQWVELSPPGSLPVLPPASKPNLILWLGADTSDLIHWRIVWDPWSRLEEGSQPYRWDWESRSMVPLPWLAESIEVWEPVEEMAQYPYSAIATAYCTPCLSLTPEALIV